MSKTLAISEDLSLPLDAATQTFAFIARKGAGKTYAAGKLTELLMDAGVQCVILDTVGNWYGLRLDADGKSKGFDIPVLGGLRGDIPLEATGGELVADLVVETGRSVIVDVSQFSLADRKRFATAFGTRLWQRKKAEPDPSPLHLVIEESQLIIPQSLRGDDARMVGIFEEIIRLGRNYGIGVSMISPRPQSVNKDVLTQTECLVVLQVNGAQERKALREWIVHQGMDVKLLDELPGLPIGTAYVWSPQWLRILKKVAIAPKRTLDASATPKVGVRRQQRELAPLDLAAFKDKMAATIERSKENDPSELKRTIAGLKRDLAKGAHAAPAPLVAPKIKQVPMFSKNEIGAINRLGTALTAMVEKMAILNEAVPLLKGLQRAVVTASAAPQIVQPARPYAMHSAQHSYARMDKPAHRPVHETAPTNGALAKAERAILRVLANFPEGKTRREIGVIAGYKHSGGGFNNAVSALRGLGYIEGGDPIRITEKGLHAFGPVEPLPTGRELFDYWMNHPKLGRAEREVLRVLFEARAPLAKEDIAPLTVSDRGTPYEANGGGFNNAISLLRTFELIDGGRGQLQAVKEFFE